jgi:hypothetical protein
MVAVITEKDRSRIAASIRACQDLRHRRHQDESPQTHGRARQRLAGRARTSPRKTREGKP